MKNPLAPLSAPLKKIVKFIGREAEGRGYESYLVGGFVRDLILSKKNLDIDIVVQGDVPALVKSLTQKLKARATLHGRFGTAALVFPGGFRLDLATARKEVYSHPGALPQVTAGNLRDDLFRRDFTINTLAVAINPSRLAEPVDLFNGREDIRKKKVRVLHVKSFEDDPTRILRAVRFEQRLGFRIETKTLALLRAALRKKMVDYVKPPRYFEEFKKLLSEPKPLLCLQRLARLGGLGFLSGGFRWSPRRSQFLKKLEEAGIRFRKKFPGKTFEPWILYFTGLLYGMNPEQQRKICRKFQLSNRETKKILACAKAGAVLKTISAKALTPGGIYRNLRPLSYETLVFIKARASSPLARRRIDHFLEAYDPIKLSIDGFDVQKAGVPAGRRVGTILEEVLQAKINGKVHSRQDELVLVNELIGNERK
jgi:tRNA nucleotidyltransferase (CCA-adding enzyme)